MVRDESRDSEVDTYFTDRRGGILSIRRPSILSVWISTKSEVSKEGYLSNEQTSSQMNLKVSLMLVGVH